MGIRPEDIYDGEEDLVKYKDGLVDTNVEVTELMGAETYLYLTSEGNNITARVAPTSTTKAGDKVKVAINVAKMHIFDKETEITILN